MNPDRKIHPKSLLTEEDQWTLYAQELGRATAIQQMWKAQYRDGRCVCDPQWVTHHWRGETKRPSHRLVHDYGCPRRKAWMQTEKLCNP